VIRNVGLSFLNIPFRDVAVGVGFVLSAAFTVTILAMLTFATNLYTWWEA